MSIRARIHTLRDTISARLAAAPRGQSRRMQAAPRTPSRRLLWGMLAVTGAALFANLVLAFDGSVLSALFAAWMGIVVARVWHALGTAGALGTG